MNPAGLASARELLGGDAEILQSDCRRRDDIVELMRRIKERFGRLDILFANAGTARFAPFVQVTEAMFDELFLVNVKGVYFTVQQAVPLIARGGSVLLNSSISSRKGFTASTVYSATKAAVRSLGRTLATELAPRGIRVNTISPGSIATPLYSKLGMPIEIAREFEKNMTQSTALKRFGQATEIASVALFLASEESAYMTGTELFVDGGLAEL